MSDWSLQCDVWLSRSGTPENPSPRMAFAAGWNARDVICDTIECPDCGTEFSVDCECPHLQRALVASQTAPVARTLVSIAW